MFHSYPPKLIYFYAYLHNSYAIITQYGTNSNVFLLYSVVCFPHWIYPSIPPKVPKPKATATPVPSPIAPPPVSSLIIKEIPIISPI